MTEKPPAPVEVVNPEPLEVRDVDQKPRDVNVVSDQTRPVDTAAQTTARSVAALAGVDAAMLRVEDQRRISGIWERTQQVIALAVVLDTLVVVSILVVAPVVMIAAGVPIDEAIKTAAVGGLLFLTAVSNLVIGFYFGRTNHTRVGGAVTRDDDIRGR